ncbi:MAG: DUF58 domain-containing protein [Anaerolineales bacterium]
MLFDEPTLRKLNQLTLVASRVRAGGIQGDRRSTKRGSSVEFADYRNYTPGDDLRRLDWNIYARLDRPFVKLFEEEEDLSVTILLDGSRSMDWGESEQNKFNYALRLTAGLGAVALDAGDQLSVVFLQDGRVAADFGPSRGSAALARLFGFLEGLHPGGQTDLNAALRQALVKPRRPGLVILISDLLSAEGYESGLREWLGRGHQAALIHVLAPDELDPPLAGDLQLVDVETGHEQDVSLDGGLRNLYRERARAWVQSTQTDCRKRGVRYLNLTTRQPWDQALLLDMRRAGIVK